MSYRLIVGLGNPGKDYEETRHNVGFRVVDALAAAKGADWKKERSFKGEFSQFVDEDGNKVYLLKPHTFMNESGTSIQKVCSYYKIPPVEVIIIYDEINMKVADVKASISSGTGGHNGMVDIVTKIAPRFTRLRIGVGQKPIKEMSLADYVLGKFEKDEDSLIASSMDRYLESLERLMVEGLDKAMNHINRRTNNNDSNQSQL